MATLNLASSPDNSHLFTLNNFDKSDRLACGVTVALFLVLSAICLSRMELAAAIFYIFALFLFALFSLFAFWFYRHESSELIGGLSNRGLLSVNLVASFLGGLLLEFLTLVGSPLSTPLDLADWGKKRIILFFALCFISITFVEWYLARRQETALSAEDVELDGNARTAAAPLVLKHGLPGLSVITLAAILIASVCTGMWSWSYGASMQRLIFLVLCVAIAASLIYLMRSTLSLHPEHAFLVLALCLGSFLSISMPPVTAISFDDQIHFDRSLGLSFLGHSEYSEADVELASVPWIHQNVIDFDQLGSTIDKLESLYANLQDEGEGSVRVGLFTPASGSSLLSVSTIGYIPSALGLWIARLFGLGAAGTVILGRWANLISYAFIFALAIRFAPAKKLLLSTIGLLPTSIYLAANYSYDPWVISFLALGFALVFREIRLSRTLTAGSFLSNAAIFAVGLCPKAIYFPVLGLFLLMPKRKFSSRRARGLFYILTFVVALIVIATFILPLFASGGSGGDTRGGSDVSVGGQISFILSNPLEFINIIGGFLLGYLSPLYSDGFTIDYAAYLGQITSVLPWLSAWLYIVLVVVSIVDVDNQSQATPGSRLGRVWVFIVFLSSVFLVATSLYISFTPVGHDTVNGCQPRYLLPVVFLGFGLISFGIRRSSSKVSTAAVLMPQVICSLASLASMVAFVVFI